MQSLAPWWRVAHRIADRSSSATACNAYPCQSEKPSVVPFGGAGGKRGGVSAAPARCRRLFLPARCRLFWPGPLAAWPPSGLIGAWVIGGPPGLSRLAVPFPHHACPSGVSRSRESRLSNTGIRSVTRCFVDFAMQQFGKKLGCLWISPVLPRGSIIYSHFVGDCHG